MTLTVGSYETATLDISPSDTDTAAALVLYSPHGATVALVEPVALVAGTGSAAGTSVATAVAGYDEPGLWVQVWTVTGTGAGVSHRTVYVDPIPLPPNDVWPPTLDELKADLAIDLSDTAQDVVLARQLAAAVRWVTGRKAGEVNFEDDSLSDLPAPSDDLALGTIRLAGRWNARRRSVDGLVSMGEMGTGRVPSFDPDIDRLLGIGRFSDSIIA